MMELRAAWTQWALLNSIHLHFHSSYESIQLNQTLLKMDMHLQAQLQFSI